MKKFFYTWIAVLLTCIPAISQNAAGDSCRADFNWKVNDMIMMFAPGMAINFYDQSQGEAVAWSWDFGDGSYSNEQNPMHIFTFLNMGGTDIDSSIYYPTVCLSIKTKNSCSSSICKAIDMMHDTTSYPGDCYVSFYAYRNDTIVTIPEVIPYSFHASAPKSTISYFWDFGDGEASTEPNPVHGYNAMVDIAFYTACLTITTEDGCTNTYCNQVRMDNYDSTNTADCQASFYYDILESFPLQYAFHDLSYGNPTAWSWDFGDGSYSSLQNPVHVFPQQREGTIYPDGYLGPPVSEYYKVCLTSVTDDNCKSTYCEFVYPGGIIDTIFPEPCPYFISVTTSNILGGNFCNGTAGASLVDSDGNDVENSGIYWSTGDSGSKTSGLCVNVPYYVSISSTEGCQVVGSFAIIDYTQPLSPFGFWTIYGDGSWYDLNYALPDTGYTCTWVFSDGTTMSGENVNYAFNGNNDKSVTINVVDESGNVVYSESINLNKSTGIKDNKVASFTLYPNPVTDNINIRLNGAITGGLQVDIYNSLGQKCISRSFNNVDPSAEISLSSFGLDHGVYYARILSAGRNPVSIAFVK